jgi:hypothetical protein
MVKNLFSNRLLIGALAFFILCVVGSLLYWQHVEKQSARELAETQKRIKAITEKTPTPAQAPVGETSQRRQPPADETPIESAPVVQPKPDVSAPVGSGYRPFNDPYLRKVDGFTVTSNFALMLAPPGVGPDWASMSAEELADAIATINRTHGAPPPPDDALWPPEGYHYAFGGTTVLSNGDNVWLDDNGYPILKKRNSPYFEIHWSENGFRPPPDVYADYKALHKRYMEIRAKTVSSPEMDRVSAEKDTLEAMYVGRIPTGPLSGGGLPGPPDMEMAERIRLFHQQYGAVQTQLKRTAYESEGIDYLMDRYSDLKPYANLHRYPELKEYAK